METKRLIIDELKIEDKKDYFINICNDKKVLETFICKYEENIDNFNFEKYLNRDDIFAIRLKDNKLIGILTIFNKTITSLEMGYAIGSKYWNNGYCTEAVKCFIDYLFNIGYKTIYASYFIGNMASKKVMEKAGMKYTHTVLNELTYIGIDRDLDYYRIDK